MRLFIGLFVLLVASTGCQPSQLTPGSPVQRDLDRPVAKADATRDEYLAALKKDMEEADRDIDVLKVRAAKATGEARQKMDRKIAELEPQRQMAHRHYEEAKADTKRAWSEIKTGMEKSWGSLKDSIQRAKDDFK